MIVVVHLGTMVGVVIIGRESGRRSGECSEMMSRRGQADYRYGLLNGQTVVGWRSVQERECPQA
jgi:hypothetical protein